MKVFASVQVSVYDFSGSNQLNANLQLFTSDRYDSLLFKLADLTNTMPSDIYCTIRQDQNTFFLHQYYINSKEITLEPADQLPALKENQNYVLLGRLPIQKQLIGIAQQIDVTVKFRINSMSLGEFLNVQNTVYIDVMLLSELSKSIDDLMKDNDTQKIIKTGFFNKYFPFKGFIKSDITQWVRMENKLQIDRQKFYKEEQKIMQMYVKNCQKVKDWETKYFIKFIDYTISFIGMRFDLKNMFNHLVLSKQPVIDSLSFYFSRDGQQFVAFKTLHQNIKPPEKSPGFELVEGTSSNIKFKVNEFGQLNLKLHIGQIFDKYPDQQFFTDKQQDVYTFIDRIMKIYYKFSAKKPKLEQAYSQTTIRYTSFSVCQLSQIKGVYEYFNKFLQQYEPVFEYNKNFGTFQTQLLSLNAQTIKFNLDGDTLQMEYIGDVCSYGDIFAQIFLIFMANQNIQTTAQTGEQTSLLSKRLMKNDPVLFGNLVDNIYSRVCQGLRQPEFVGQDQKDQPFVFQYWNFTTNQSQYYKCNEQYPFLSFKLGQHKNNLCIPCCSNKNQMDTKKRKQIYQQCIQQRIVQKTATTDSNYIFRNVNKFMIGRCTALNNDFQQYIGQDMYIHCISMPTGTRQQVDTVYSLVKSIAFLVDVQIDQFLDDFETFHHQGVKNDDFISQLINLRQRSLFSSYDIMQWKVSLQQYLAQKFNINLYLLETKNEVHQINYMKTSNDFDIVIRQTGDIYNPVVKLNSTGIIKILEQVISENLKSHNNAQMGNGVDRIAYILQNNSHIEPISQILTQRGLCKYVLCKIHDQKYILLPVELSTPMSEIPASKAIDIKIIKDYASVQEVLQLADLYSGSIDYSIYVKGEIKAFVKKNLIFYIPIIVKTDTLPTQIQTAPVLNNSFDPLIMNIMVFNKQSFNRTIYSQVLNSIYYTHIYDLIQMSVIEQLHMSKNSQSISIDQLSEVNYQKLVCEISDTELQQKILQKLQQVSQKQQIDEIGTLYTCKKNPSQFFCNGDKLIITPEMYYLTKLLQQQVIEKSLDFSEFQRGLFIMIGKFQFKQGPGEILQIVQLQSKSY